MWRALNSKVVWTLVSLSRDISLARNDYLPKEVSWASELSSTALLYLALDAVPALDGAKSRDLTAFLYSAIVRRQSATEIWNEEITHACHSARLCMVANEVVSALFEPRLLGTILKVWLKWNHFKWVCTGQALNISCGNQAVCVREEMTAWEVEGVLHFKRRAFSLENV